MLQTADNPEIKPIRHKRIRTMKMRITRFVHGKACNVLPMTLYNFLAIVICLILRGVISDEGVCQKHTCKYSHLHRERRRCSRVSALHRLHFGVGVVKWSFIH